MTISVDKINNYAPYHILEVDNGTFSFSTKYGVEYCIGFVKDESFMKDGAYQFFITNLNNAHSPKDENVAKTIQCVIEEFFSTEPVVMLYICDVKDGKQGARNRMFKIWYETYMLHDAYSMYNEQLTFDGTVYFASVLLRKDHPLHNEVIINFHNFIVGLPEKVSNLQNQYL